MPISFYDVLGVDAGASKPEVAAAYARCSARLERMRRDGVRPSDELERLERSLLRAWTVLSDAMLRTAYDVKREARAGDNLPARAEGALRSAHELVVRVVPRRPDPQPVRDRLREAGRRLGERVREAAYVRDWARSLVFAAVLVAAFTLLTAAIDSVTARDFTVRPASVPAEPAVRAPVLPHAER